MSAYLSILVARLIISTLQADRQCGHENSVLSASLVLHLLLSVMSKSVWVQFTIYVQQSTLALNTS